MNDAELVTLTLASPFRRTPVGRFLGARGTSMLGSPLPPGVRQAPAGECFRNARELCLSRGLQYWQGWAWHPTSGAMPYDHAWCVDEVTAAVVDPTWRDAAACHYLGVHVPTRRLCDIFEATGTFGVLDLGSGFASDIVERHFDWRDDHGDELAVEWAGALPGVLPACCCHPLVTVCSRGSPKASESLAERVACLHIACKMTARRV